MHERRSLSLAPASRHTDQKAASSSRKCSEMLMVLRPGHSSGIRRTLAPTPRRAAATFGCAFDQEHHRTGIFAANRKSLHHPQYGQRDRRQEAPRRVSRQ
jgi:hypothetical protein